MADPLKPTNPGFDWLYPELLSEKALRQTLAQRYIQTENIQALGKDKLVELYNKYIIPLPQRKYRSNRRGQQMTKAQIIAAKKRKLLSPVEDGPSAEKKRSCGLLTSFERPAIVVDRLKPPPACIDFEKKKIKLSSSSSSQSSSPISSSLNKLNISKTDTSITLAGDKSPTKKIKLIQFNSDQSKSKAIDNTINDGYENNTCARNGKVALSLSSSVEAKGSLPKHTDSTNPPSPMDTSDNQGTDVTEIKEKKNKITKISWP